MKSLKTMSAAAAFVLAACAPAVSDAGVTVLSEGFDDVAALPGWVQVNNSTPVGRGWYQGNPGIFTAQAGAEDSYIAANFLSAAFGFGLTDNWLITPVLDLSGFTKMSFHTRQAAAPGFSSELEVRFSSGSAATGDFSTLLATVGGASTYPGSWQKYSATVMGTGSGRFAFRYLGDAEALTQIGIDTVNVVTAVPEPSTLLMLCLGLGALVLLRRQAHK